MKLADFLIMILLSIRYFTKLTQPVTVPISVEIDSDGSRSYWTAIFAPHSELKMKS